MSVKSDFLKWRLFIIYDFSTIIQKQELYGKIMFFFDVVSLRIKNLHIHSFFLFHFLIPRYRNLTVLE